MAAISLLLSEWGWRNKATANFYLAPTRAWELFSGSIAAFVVQKQGVQKNNFLAMLGLAAIIFSIFAFDEVTPFPSVYALVPVLGVVLLVLYADTGTLAAKLLSTKVFVGIGLISYSAYLWHQPFFAFARIALDGHPSPYLMATLSIISVALAYLSWRFIEKPFRNPKIVSKTGVFIFLIIGMTFFLSVGLIGHYKNGFSIHNNLQPNVDASKLANVNLPIYVIGDSHADHLIFGLEQLNNSSVVNMSSNGCIPFRDVDRYDFRFEVGTCARTINAHLDTLKTVDKPSIVILSSMGPVYLDGTPFNGKDYERVTGLRVELITDYTVTNHHEVFEIGMRNTLAELSSNPNLTTIFALDVPELGIDNGCQHSGKQIDIFGHIITDLTSSLTVESCAVSREEYDQRTERYRDLVYRVLEDFPSIYSFDPTDIFCTTKFCSGVINNFGYLYRDIDHLSTNGSLYYANSLFNSFDFFENE